MTHLKEIKKAIIDKITPIVPVVYGYEKGEMEKYPAAMVYSTEINPEWADTEQDKDIMVFKIGIYQEINNQTPEKAEDLVDDIVVSIIEAFQQDWRIGKLVDKTTIRATKGWVSREVQTRAATITITTTSLKKII